MTSDRALTDVAWRVPLVVILACIAVSTATGYARAALPGRNGALAYGSTIGGEDLEIAVSRSDGSRLRTLTDTRAFEACASWSPDGDHLLFCRFKGSGFDLWIMDADGGEPRNLTSTPDIDETFGAFSPDGTRIAFMSTASGDGSTDIWVMEADGAVPTQLTDEPAPGGDWRPTWHADGRTLFFERDVSDVDGNLLSADIWTVDVETGAETQLTDTARMEFFPDVSPDGSRIVFSGDGDIYVMNADGSGEKRLTDHPRFEQAPTFSPDGTRIAYLRFSPDESTSDVFVMQADGGDVLRVTRTRGREAAPSWEPRA